MDPGLVEEVRGGSRPVACDPVGLLDEGDGEAAAGGDLRGHDKVWRPAARAVAEHERAARPARQVVQVRSCRAVRVSSSTMASNGSLGAMFDRVGIAVSDLVASERFYRTVLSVLGVTRATRTPS